MSKLFWGSGFPDMIRLVALEDPSRMSGNQLCFPFLGRLKPPKPVSPWYLESYPLWAYIQFLYHLA